MRCTNNCALYTRPQDIVQTTMLSLPVEIWHYYDDGNELNGTSLTDLAETCERYGKQVAV